MHSAQLSWRGLELKDYVVHDGGKKKKKTFLQIDHILFFEKIYRNAKENHRADLGSYNQFLLMAKFITGVTLALTRAYSFLYCFKRFCNIPLIEILSHC